MFIREWNPQTWALGTLYEVQIKKTMRCDQFADYIQQNLFPHIPKGSLFGAKVDMTYIRSSLALKKWQSLAA